MLELGVGVVLSLYPRKLLEKKGVSPYLPSRDLNAMEIP